MAEELRRKFSIDDEVDLDSVLTSNLQNSMQHNVFIRGEEFCNQNRVTTTTNNFSKPPFQLNSWRKPMNTSRTEWSTRRLHIRLRPCALDFVLNSTSRRNRRTEVSYGYVCSIRNFPFPQYLLLSRCYGQHEPRAKECPFQKSQKPRPNTRRMVS